MPFVRRLYVDTNIFIRAFEPSDELAIELERLLSIEKTMQPPFFVTSELTLTELLCGPFRTGDDRLVELYDNWTRSNPYIEVIPVKRPVLWNAAALRSQNPPLKTPDAIHIATALHSGCSHLLTGDKSIADRYRLHWWRYECGVQSDLETIRPDFATIREIIDAHR